MIESTSYTHVAILAIVGLIVVADVWAIVHVVRRRAMTVPLKIVWAIVILWLPVLGVVLLLVSQAWPRLRRTSSR
jgi:hypothetical protein